MSNTQGIISAFVIGACLAAQGPINAALARGTSIRVASFHSILTSLLIAGAVVLFTDGFGTYANIVRVHPLYWTGGILGVIIVFLTTRTIPVLGTAAFFSIIVPVQIIAGALINNFGILGVEKNPLSAAKLAGMALILIGVRLVIK